MEYIEYDNNILIDFYVQNGLEFNENKKYFGTNVKSFVILKNKKIIGAVTISLYKDKNYIEALAVDKDYRHKGYGKSLLDKAIKELGKPVYTISKIDDFYLKNGFVYDNVDLIDEKCKMCDKYKTTCFPNVVAYK